MLERFNRIVLWMDNDTPGVEGAQQFAVRPVFVSLLVANLA